GARPGRPRLAAARRARAVAADSPIMSPAGDPLMAPGQGPLYGASMQATCAHLAQIRDVGPGRDVCESCIEIGGTWVHLRLCLICGRTGCCDSSPNRHASRHAHDEGHPIAKSLEPEEDWGWCFVEDLEPGQDECGAWHPVDS